MAQQKQKQEERAAEGQAQMKEQLRHQAEQAPQKEEQVRRAEQLEEQARLQEQQVARELRAQLQRAEAREAALQEQAERLQCLVSELQAAPGPGTTQRVFMGGAQAAAALHCTPQGPATARTLCSLSSPPPLDNSLLLSA
jgi:hypothetical protein